jgi:transcriptional regulator with XRE-family HTH domain
MSETLSGRIGEALRAARADRGLTLVQLASVSGVSKSMISMVERAEANPSAAILSQLAAALGIPLARFFQGRWRTATRMRAKRDQLVWRDPETGYLRKALSPDGGVISLAEVTLPPGREVTLDNGPNLAAFEQQILVIEGRLLLTIGSTCHDMSSGDCAMMRLDAPVRFSNPASSPVRYLVAVAADGPDGGGHLDGRSLDAQP